ncbi:MAG TPA: hypothetical protein VJ372_10340, partial [Pyrinomonadaceae bacterium]|nr:hypothetical protein [Pyrinomonadaceae bacterium]
MSVNELITSSPIPPKAVGGSVQILLTRAYGEPSENPTNGSWWLRSDATYENAWRTVRESHQ